MASEDASVPDGFEAYDDGYDGDEETFELTPGESLHGTVLNIQEKEGDYGPYWMLKFKDKNRGVGTYFAEDQVKKACRKEDLQEGAEVFIRKLVEERSLSDGDGSYNPVELRMG